jgi:Asp-tRNA(Asn)/Glu-tRNA(Gln) amidotransferase A subunit family amidase
VRCRHALPAVLALAALMAAPHPAAAAPTFEVAEASIVDLQAALAAGTTTSRQLVSAYLARIAAYDQGGPRLNSIITLNGAALAEADALDRERAATGPRGPLHGIPILVKDNYDTADMPTSGGTLALATLRPVADAFQVARLRAAGAIILGKTTLHELAAGVITVSSLSGASRNPYDPARSPGGSSGGTGAAVAASFAAAGMGSDTCGSIRIPSAYQNLFGLRTTRGLSSRSGVIPLSETQDVAGPLARSVTDLAIMLDATVGEDPHDASTRGAGAQVPASYRDSLRPGALQGARVGVLRTLFANTPEDGEGQAVVDRALATLRAEGAVLIDVEMPGLVDLLADAAVIPFEFKEDFAAYLARQPKPPLADLDAILAAGLHHDLLDTRFRERNIDGGRAAPGYQAALAARARAKAATEALLAEQTLDALLYPTVLLRPPLIGGDNVANPNNCRLSPSTGLPALAIPAGFSPRGLPFGIELLGPAFSEPRLLALAYGWEAAARPRQAPFSTPPLVNGKAPEPLAFTTRIAVDAGGGATINWRYDPVTAKLAAAVTVAGLGKDAPVAVTLHRRFKDGSGPVLAPLLFAGQSQGQAELVLDERDRSDLAAGRLYAALYTRAAPLGAGQAVLTLPAR